MPSESDIKRMIKKDIRDHGGYARRIEDQYAVGIYDMILIPYNLPVFMTEVKMIRDNTFGPTDRQYVELLRIEAVRGTNNHVIPLLIGWKNSVYYFHRLRSNVDRRNCFSVTTSNVCFHDQLVQFYHTLKGQLNAEPEHRTTPASHR